MSWPSLRYNCQSIQDSSGKSEWGLKLKIWITFGGSQLPEIAKFWRIFLCTWHTHPNPMYLWPSIGSVQFSCSVMSDYLWPHELYHNRLPCPSPTHRVYSNSCPLCQWCHPTISSFVIPFSSRLQSFPAGNIRKRKQERSGLFQWVSSSHQVTKVLEFQLQHQSFQWIFRTDFL